MNHKYIMLIKDSKGYIQSNFIYMTFWKRLSCKNREADWWLRPSLAEGRGGVDLQKAWEIWECGTVPWTNHGGDYTTVCVYLN